MLMNSSSNDGKMFALFAQDVMRTSFPSPSFLPLPNLHEYGTLVIIAPFLPVGYFANIRRSSFSFCIIFSPLHFRLGERERERRGKYPLLRAAVQKEIMFDPGVGEGGISQKSPDFPCTHREARNFCVVVGFGWREMMMRGRRRRFF